MMIENYTDILDFLVYLKQNPCAQSQPVEKGQLFKEAIENMCLHDKIISENATFKFDVIERLDEASESSWQIPNLKEKLNDFNIKSNIFSNYFTLNFKVIKFSEYFRV